jgi:hypothetical protein
MGFEIKTSFARASSYLEGMELVFLRKRKLREHLFVSAELPKGRSKDLRP